MKLIFDLDDLTEVTNSTVTMKNSSVDKPTINTNSSKIGVNQITFKQKCLLYFH